MILKKRKQKKPLILSPCLYALPCASCSIHSQGTTVYALLLVPFSHYIAHQSAHTTASTILNHIAHQSTHTIASTILNHIAYQSTHTTPSTIFNYTNKYTLLVPFSHYTAHQSMHYYEHHSQIT